MKVFIARTFSDIKPSRSAGKLKQFRWLIPACLILNIASAQPRVQDTVLMKKLEGKSRLEDIMEVVTDYYKQHPGIIQQSSAPDSYKGNPLTKWARWAYEQSSRLDEKGNVTDYVGKNFAVVMSLEGKEITQQSNTGNWSQIGPLNAVYGSNPQNFLGLGRVDRIAFHPNNANIIYAGTPAGGLWRTNDNGSNWSLLTKYLPSPGISGIVVSSNNANSIYILTGDGDSNIGGGLVSAMGYVRRSVGVLRSTDGGSSWYLTGRFPNATANMVGYKLVQDPNNAEVLIAATSEGLYRTTNGGNTWTRVRTGRFWDVIFKHNSSSTAYATGDGADRFVRSTDGGASWTTADITWSPATPSGTGRGQLAVGTSATGAVYILWGPVTANGVFKGLYYSSNSGIDFTRQTTTPNILGRGESGEDNNDQSSYDLGIAVKPTNSAQLFTAGLTVWSSPDRGITMVKSTSFRESGSFAYIHPDVHDIKYHPTSGWLYAATDGGMYRSNNDGDSWTNISPGIATTQFYKGNGFAGNSTFFLGGAQDNGIHYRPSATGNFRFVLCCDGFDAEFHPDNAAKAYASMNTDVFSLNLNGGGSSISPWVNGKWFINVETHPSNGNIVYIGADSLCRSDDGGATWTLQTPINAGWALAATPSNNNRLYAAGGNAPWASSGNIRRSDDQGSTWININGTTFAPNNLKVTDIAAKPNNSPQVWATIGGYSDGNKVFRTNNAAANPVVWTNVSGSLPNVPVNCVAVDANNNAYVGTDIGVYYMGAGMSDWVPFYNYLPRVPVTSLILHETDAIIKAVTFGQGVWQSPVYSGCQANVAVNGNVTGYKLFEAGTSLTSTAFVYGGDNTEVFYKSGNSITLSPGFESVGGNTVFKAYIGPCGNGMPEVNAAFPVKTTTPVLESNTSFPYGLISANPAGRPGTVSLSLPADGTYRLVAADADGRPVAELMPATAMKTGKHNIACPVRPGNTFYLQLWKDNMLCDQKEW